RPAASCSTSTACRSILPRMRSRLRSPSWRSRRASCSASRSNGMKASDARAMTPDQLSNELMKLKKEQFNLRFQRATGQLENTGRVREVRRDIARVKTIAAQKRAAEKAK